jgi:hypothetical protein
LIFDRRAALGAPELLMHAFSRVGLEKELMDWSDYEAATDHFPVRFRAGLERPDVYGIYAAPERLNVTPFRNEIDYVFCWKMPPQARQARRLLRPFALVYQQPLARVYERRSRVRARWANLPATR